MKDYNYDKVVELLTLGDNYLSGRDGFKKNIKKACEFYLEAAKEGSEDAFIKYFNNCSKIDYDEFYTDFFINEAVSISKYKEIFLKCFKNKKQIEKRDFDLLLSLKKENMEDYYSIGMILHEKKYDDVLIIRKHLQYAVWANSNSYNNIPIQLVEKYNIKKDYIDSISTFKDFAQETREIIDKTSNKINYPFFKGNFSKAKVKEATARRIIEEYLSNSFRLRKYLKIAPEIEIEYSPCCHIKHTCEYYPSAEGYRGENSIICLDHEYTRNFKSVEIIDTHKEGMINISGRFNYIFTPERSSYYRRDVFTLSSKHSNVETIFYEPIYVFKYKKGKKIFKIYLNSLNSQIFKDKTYFGF